MPDPSSDDPQPVGHDQRAMVVEAVATMATTVALGTAAYALAPLGGDRSWIGGLMALAAIAVLAPLTLRRARAIAGSDRPVVDASVAIVFLLTVLILGFAGLYVVIAGHEGQMVGIDTKVDAVYFTVTTLSTVGYGDVHAVGQAARVVVTVQILFNLAFLAGAVRMLAVVARRRLDEQTGERAGVGAPGRRPPPP